MSAMALTFLEDPSAEAHPGSDEFHRRVWEPHRRWGARSRGRWVGTLATRPTTLTVPGVEDDALEVPADALTMVTVSATHRRRGIMTAMLGRSLAEGKERGDAVGILFAAEWPIYGRFGYAPATLSANYSLDPRNRGAGIQPLDTGSVYGIEPDELGKHAPDIYAAARRRRAGNIERPPQWWHRFLGLEGLTVQKVHGRQPNLFAHDGPAGPDGFVAWVATSGFDPGSRLGAIEVVDLCAATDEAYRALWAYLMSIDLVSEIVLPGRPVDEPVRWLMRDGRALEQIHTGDAVWLRLLDVPAALSARRYGVTRPTDDRDRRRRPRWVRGWALSPRWRDRRRGVPCRAAVQGRSAPAPARPGLDVPRRLPAAGEGSRRARRGVHGGRAAPGRRDVRHADCAVVRYRVLIRRGQLLGRGRAGSTAPRCDRSARRAARRSRLRRTGRRRCSRCSRRHRYRRRGSTVRP